MCSRRGIDQSLDYPRLHGIFCYRFPAVSASRGSFLSFNFLMCSCAILSGSDRARGIELLIIVNCSCAGNCHVLLFLIQDCFRFFGLELGLLIEMATHLVFIEFLAPLADHHCGHAVAD